MAILHLTNDNFDAEVMQSKVPVLVDFWAAWCGPCRALAPTIDEIAAEVNDKKICKVNVDEEPGLAQRFGVMSIPTLIVIKGGKVVEQAVGARGKADIAAMMDRHL